MGDHLRVALSSGWACSSRRGAEEAGCEEIDRRRIVDGEAACKYAF